MKKTTKTIIGIAIGIFLTGVMVCTLVYNKRQIDQQKVVKTGITAIAVTVAPAKTINLTSELNFAGTAEPCKEVIVSAESSGKVVKVNFKLGDFVVQGTELVQVEDIYKRLAYESATLNYNKLKEDYERFQVLHKGEAVTEVQLRDMKLGYENAKIQFENAKKQYEDTKVLMPFSGYITSKNTELGAFVNYGVPIAGIADISELKVTFGVSETEAYRLKIGQNVSVSSAVYPDAKYNARIASIGEKSNNAHIYPVEIMLSNNGRNKLKAGTYVNVSAEITQDTKVLVIPREAIISTIKDPTVYVVDGNSVRLNKIKIGRSHDALLEVLSGLNEGDQVVINGQINLSDGSKISIVKNE